MRVEYTLTPKQKATVRDTIISPYVFKIDQAEVTMEINKNKIDKLKISFHKIGYDLSPLGKQTKIILHKKELRYNAYKICSYISNRIYTESGTDAFDCNELIDNDTPEIYPENQSEQNDTSRFDIFRTQIFRFVSPIVNFVDFDGCYSEGYRYEKAYTAYAEGLRANSVITRYVQFYKAMEAILGDKMKDKDASDIAEKHNQKFNESRIAELRVLRNRCEHPHQAKGHISTSDIRDIKEVEQNLPDLAQVVRILFDHFKDQTEHKEITSEREN